MSLPTVAAAMAVFNSADGVNEVFSDSTLLEFIPAVRAHLPVA